jgi:Cu/Ag efflux pump CusA
MMSIWDFLFPVERSIATAAFIGTIVLLLNGKKRAKIAIVTVVAGNYLAAVYLTNLIAEMANLKSLEGIAFAIGVGGFSLVDKVISEIPKQLNNHLNGNTNPPAE